MLDVELDAIVLVDAATAGVRIAGLSIRERAERVARRAGATRVIVEPADGERQAIAAWRGERTCPVLAIRADQLVHTPLVAPLVAAIPVSGMAIAVGPDGEYAGALVAGGDAVAGVIAALARGESDTALSSTADTRIPHGAVARHPVATADDRRRAHEYLYQLLTKPQDNVITRYLFRPVSSRLSRLLVRTPVTATQVSIVVAILVAYGCWLTLEPQPSYMIAGALVILLASYLDCCDGEIARIKLQASTFGAWLDTIVDELSSIGYMVAIGWHCHRYYGPSYFGDLGYDPWTIAILVGLATYLWSLFCIYYNIIVGVGSANSQDYTSRFVIVGGKLVPKPAGPARELPRWLRALVDFWPNLARRDFIVWLCALYAVLRVPHISFATHIVGGLVSSVVCTIDHVHLRRMRRKCHEASASATTGPEPRA